MAFGRAGGGHAPAGLAPAVLPGGGGAIRWRTEAGGAPEAIRFISSPRDPEARYAPEDATTRVGYGARLTETCDEDTPHPVAHVETPRGRSPAGARRR
jgi:hypothetical protein